MTYVVGCTCVAVPVVPAVPAGDWVQVPYDGVSYNLRVLEVQPGNAVSVIDTDIAADVGPSIETEGYLRAREEQEAREAERQRQIQEQAEHEAAQVGEQGWAPVCGRRAHDVAERLSSNWSDSLWRCNGQPVSCVNFFLKPPFSIHGHVAGCVSGWQGNGCSTVVCGCWLCVLEPSWHCQPAQAWCWAWFYSCMFPSYHAH